MNKNPTLYPEINSLLGDYCQEVQACLGGNVIGIYLFGSLTYGDFDINRSDIDLMVVVKEPVSDEEYARIQELHQSLLQRYPEWLNRFECSYTPVTMLLQVIPPSEPRPYFGEGRWYREAQYGNEWIINLYLTYHYGIALTGKPFQTLIDSPDIVEVQRASARDFYQEWLPKLSDDAWLNDPHYQSYLVLNLCRIINTVCNGTVLSKKKSAAWVKEKYPQWQELIVAAEEWHYGKHFPYHGRTSEMIRFTKKIIEDIHSNESVT